MLTGIVLGAFTGAGFALYLKHNVPPAQRLWASFAIFFLLFLGLAFYWKTGAAPHFDGLHYALFYASIALAYYITYVNYNPSEAPPAPPEVAPPPDPTAPTTEQKIEQLLKQNKP